ncbi:MAG: B-box zinc finger protein [Candidatus Thorarchaeota archaeon]
MTLDSSSHRCPVCQRNRANHFCEDCGTVLCSECLDSRTSDIQICRDCHATFISHPGEEEISKCPECESENVDDGRRTVDMCPRCHSGRIVLLEEKRRSLAQDLRHAVMSIQYGHTKLREFNSKLDSAKRTLVSLRMANFLHYHWLEEKMESIQAEMPAIKNRIANQAEIVAKQITAETKGLIDYNRWTPSQFPFIEGVTNRVTELGTFYKQHVDDALNEVKPRLEEIEAQLDGLSYHRKEFSEFYDYGELAVNELPVAALPDIRVVGSNFLKNDKAYGTLYITNKRLFLVAEKGRLRKKTEMVFEFPLMYLKEIEEDGRLRKKLVLKLKQGDLKISCSEETKKVMPDYFEIAKKFEKYMQSDLQRVRKIEQNTLNISDVRLKIEGLVYSLLSTAGGASEELSRVRARRPEFNPYRPETVRYDYTDKPYSQAKPFRSRLEETIARASYRQDTPYAPRTPDMEYLRRNALEIENALKETVHLMRNGHLVPEDFIRRYRGLMRDSYQTQREIDRVTRNGYRW